MYKICLVEDEFVVREGIKNNVSWEKEGFIIVGDESDGELAYQMIVREQPDILITDIKMPFMSGLELSKLLKKEMPQIKIIIISGYNDFSYAQEAIDIGVTEYLLKPITSNKLLKAVKNAAKVIEKERKEKKILEQYKLLVYQEQEEKRKDFFNELVSGKMSFSKIVEKEAELGINMVASTFCIVLFQFMVKENIYEYSNEIVQCEVEMKKSLREYNNIIFFERNMDGWAFVLLGDNKEQIGKLVRELSNLLKHISDDVHYFGGVGRVVNRISELPQSYIDANKAFSLRYFKRIDQFLSYQDVNIINEQIGKKFNVSELHLEKLDRILLEEFLKKGTKEDVDEFVDRYFDKLDSNAMNSTLFCHYIIMDGYSVIIKFLKNINSTKKKIANSLRDINYGAKQLTGIEECNKFYKSILKEAIDLRNKNNQKKHSKLIEKAKEFIRHNYSDSDLTLNKVASHVNLSPNYFSALFNQEEGITFIEYLTYIRMNKAKEYLRCSSKKISEIAFSVGYLDSHYFSHIFKKTHNYTPSEYRLRGTSKC